MSGLFAPWLRGGASLLSPPMDGSVVVFEPCGTFPESHRRLFTNEGWTFLPWRMRADREVMSDDRYTADGGVIMS